MAQPNLSPEQLAQIMGRRGTLQSTDNGSSRYWYDPSSTDLGGGSLDNWQIVLNRGMDYGQGDGGENAYNSAKDTYTIQRPRLEAEAGNLGDMWDQAGNYLGTYSTEQHGWKDMMTAIALMAGGYAGGTYLSGAQAAGAGGLSASQQAAMMAANGMTDAQIAAALGTSGAQGAGLAGITGGTAAAGAGGVVGGAGGAGGAAGLLGSASSWMPLVTGAAGLYSNYAKGEAAKDASQIQANAAQSGIDEQRRQFDMIQGLLAPYAQAGTKAVGAQGDLAGLNGAAQQQAAIAGLQGSPEFTALMSQGENAILQNASATGGLRGGNTQAALAQYRPQLLAQLINQQYARLGGLTSVGQNAAAGVGNAGMQTGANVANLLGQQGAAGAGGALAGGNTDAGYAAALAQMFGMFNGMGTPAPSGTAGGTGIKVNGF
jgi:hypothetical protein